MFNTTWGARTAADRPHVQIRFKDRQTKKQFVSPTMYGQIKNQKSLLHFFSN